MASKARARQSESTAPPGFRVTRDLPVGRHPLLAAFPGLEKLGTAKRFIPQSGRRSKLLDETCVEIVAQDVWMYVAPWDVPKSIRARGWRPVVSPGSDCIVIGEKHLRTSPELMLFMDIFHELCHVRQRQDGAELFRGDVSYVHRTTEIDAYRFVIEEARRLGASDVFLRDYLHVEWIDDSEFHELLRTLGVATPS